jgi:hypothetical protein
LNRLKIFGRAETHQSQGPDRLRGQERR